MDYIEALQIQFYPRVPATFHCNQELLEDFQKFLESKDVSVRAGYWGEQSGKPVYLMEVSREDQDLSQAEGNDLITKFFASRK